MPPRFTPRWRPGVRIPLQWREIIRRACGERQSVNEWILQQIEQGLQAHIRFTDGKDAD